MTSNCAENKAEHAGIASFATIGNGRDLARLFYELTVENDHSCVANQLAAAIACGLDIAKLICDGTLTSESRGFWSFSNHWPEVVTGLSSGMFQCVVDVTARLFMLGGNDLLADIPLDALVEYGEKNLGEVEQMINYALTKDETTCCVMGLFKVGFEHNTLTFLSTAIQMLENEGLDDKKKSSIYSGLRFLKLTDLSESQKQRVFDILKHGLESNSKDILYAVGSTLIHLYAKAKVCSLWKLIETTLSSGSSIARLGILNRFPSLREKGVANELSWQLLNALTFKGFGDREARAIDTILAAVWNKTSEQALKYLEKVVVNSDEGSIGSESFPKTMKKLKEMTGAFINQAVTRWFLSNDVRMFRFANELMKGRDKDTDYHIEVDVTAIGDHAAKPWFVGRKGIGWFYYYHKTCVTFVMSCMAAMSEEVLQDFKQSFFNPLCLHYTDDVAEYLESRKGDAGKPYYKMAQQVLKLSQTIFEKARLVLPMPDFEPSARQRAAFARYHDKQMSSVFRRVREENPLLKLFMENPVILLHGTKMVEWHRDEKGDYKRTENPLIHHRIRFEFPSLQRLDGLTLDYELRRMQFERLVYETDC